MMNKNDFERIMLTRMKFYVSSVVSPELFVGTDMAVEVIADKIWDNWIANLKATVWGREFESVSETVYVPFNWFEALKGHLPLWMRNLWPVRYREIVVQNHHYYICPHLNIKSQDKHLEFLRG